MHGELEHEIESAARHNLARVLDVEMAPDRIDLDLDMVGEYGLTSLNKVLFLTAVCDETGVSVSHFTERDLAGMRTLRDVATALVHYATAQAAGQLTGEGSAR